MNLLYPVDASALGYRNLIHSIDSQIFITSCLCKHQNNSDHIPSISHTHVCVDNAMSCTQVWTMNALQTSSSRSLECAVATAQKRIGTRAHNNSTCLFKRECCHNRYSFMREHTTRLDSQWAYQSVYQPLDLMSARTLCLTDQ